MPEFHDRLEHLDERYEHLKKHVKLLHNRMHELEAILRGEEEHDEETVRLTKEIIENIKREKEQLRDEASIIRGELSNATFKEDGRRNISGAKRREEELSAARERWLAEKEEREAREAIEKERKRQERLKEEEAERERSERMAEVERSRAIAMERLKNIHLYLGDPTESEEGSSYLGGEEEGEGAEEEGEGEEAREAPYDTPSTVTPTHTASLNALNERDHVNGGEGARKRGSQRSKFPFKLFFGRRSASSASLTKNQGKKKKKGKMEEDNGEVRKLPTETAF